MKGKYRGGNFAGGIFRCAKFRTSNVCKISHSIFTPLCEINLVRNLATDAKFSQWGFAGIAGGMLLPSPPPTLISVFFNCFLSKANLIRSPSVTTCKGGRLCLCKKKVFSHQAHHCKTGATVVASGY